MYEYKVKEVLRVIDGDTVDITIDLGFDLTKKERVRVAGVDTPEKRTRCKREKQLGYDATHFAETWFAEGGDITVKTSKDGKYGRMLGYFWRGEECFNTQLVELGYAFEYWGETKRDMKDVATLEILLAKRGYSDWESYAEASES